ncbi:MAG TPA: hypothetical protein VLJ17_07595 [Xanthobacteraceae bacterium]|nr:hypothetical protein [Xanthobacteraceae bacterium]
MRVFAASLAMMGLASTAMAQSRLACVRATDQTVTSLAECATYERTRVACFVTRSPSDNDVWIIASRKLSRVVGELMIKIARMAEISNDDVVERLQAASEKMLTTMDGSCVNVPVLARKYEDFCTKLTDNPNQLLVDARNCMLSDR